MITENNTNEIRTSETRTSETYTCNSSNNYVVKCEKIKNFFLNDEYFAKKPKSKTFIKTFEQLFTSFCHNQNDEILIDFRYFKILEKINGFHTDIIIEYLVKMIQNILMKRDRLFFHVYLQSFTLVDMEKQYNFIYKLHETVNNLVPNISDKLEKCFLYKAPFVLTQIFSLLSSFVEKKTLANIQVVS